MGQILYVNSPDQQQKAQDVETEESIKQPEQEEEEHDEEEEQEHEHEQKREVVHVRRSRCAFDPAHFAFDRPAFLQMTVQYCSYNFSPNAFFRSISANSAKSFTEDDISVSTTTTSRERSFVVSRKKSLSELEER